MSPDSAVSASGVLDSGLAWGRGICSISSCSALAGAAVSVSGIVGSACPERGERKLRFDGTAPQPAPRVAAVVLAADVRDFGLEVVFAFAALALAALAAWAALASAAFAAFAALTALAFAASAAFAALASAAFAALAALTALASAAVGAFAFAVVALAELFDDRPEVVALVAAAPDPALRAAVALRDVRAPRAGLCVPGVISLAREAAQSDWSPTGPSPDSVSPGSGPPGTCLSGGISGP